MKAFFSKIMISGITFLVVAPSLLAAGRARVEVSAKKLTGDLVEFTFKTIPLNGLKINAEGPWKLQITEATPIKFDKPEMKRSEWKESDAAFVQAVKASGKATSAQLSYKLTAFVCTEDKGQCFREVLTGKNDVKW
jgi:hypothetical protein